MSTANVEPAIEPRDVDWQQVKRCIKQVVVSLEPHAAASAPSFQLSKHERDELARLTALPPATRNFAEVRSMLNLLRGTDVLLQLDDEQQASVAGAMKWEQYEKGLVVATEHNAGDAYLLLVEGQLSVLVRDTSVRSMRSKLRDLWPGECFAESMMIEHSQKMPSLVASEDSVLLRVSRTDFFAAHSSWQMELLERKISALQMAACFGGAERRALRAMAERMTQERMHAGRVVISQGAEPQRLYCIGSGECKVLMKTGGGKMLQIAKLGPGAIFGEVCAVSPSSSHAPLTLPSRPLQLSRFPIGSGGCALRLPAHRLRRHCRRCHPLHPPKGRRHFRSRSPSHRGDTCTPLPPMWHSVQVKT